MRDEVAVGVTNTTNYLFEKKPSFILRDVIILNVIVKFSTLCKFHDDEDVIGCIKDFIEFDDVLVVDEFEYFDLSFDLDRKRVTFEIIFLFFILRLLMILTATLSPVRSCLASESMHPYLSLYRSLLFRSSSPKYNDRCAPTPSA